MWKGNKKHFLCLSRFVWFRGKSRDFAATHEQTTQLYNIQPIVFKNIKPAFYRKVHSLSECASEL